MTKYPELFAALAAPFDSSEVKVRSQAGRQFHYITARTVMNRLDDVLGPEGWWPEYTAHENSVECRLSIRLPDGSILTKADAGGYAGMADSGDDDKSGYSDALKRAACVLGCGRYLYRDGVPRFVQERAGGEVPNEPAPRQSGSDRPRGQWGNAQGNPAPPHREPGGDDDRDDRGQEQRQQTYGVPRTGKALFAWARDVETKTQVGIIKFLTGWARLQEFPARMIDFTPEQVALAHAEATRKLQAVGQPDDATYEEALSN